MGPWAYVVTYDEGAARWRLQVGRARSIERTAAHLGEDLRVVRRVWAYGGELRSYEGTASSKGTLLAWVGPYHQLSVWVAGTDVPLDGFQRLLQRMVLADAPSGLQIRRRPGCSSRMAFVGGFNSIERLCGLSVHPLELTNDLLPLHKGLEVPGGELWMHEPSEPGEPDVGIFLLVGRSTATVFSPLRADLTEKVAVLARSVEIMLDDRAVPSLTPA